MTTPKLRNSLLKTDKQKNQTVFFWKNSKEDLHSHYNTCTVEEFKEPKPNDEKKIKISSF
jgi:hypothetical protein